MSRKIIAGLGLALEFTFKLELSMVILWIDTYGLLFFCLDLGEDFGF